MHIGAEKDLIRRLRRHLPQRGRLGACAYPQICRRKIMRMELPGVTFGDSSRLRQRSPRFPRPMARSRRGSDSPLGCQTLPRRCLRQPQRGSLRYAICHRKCQSVRKRKMLRSAQNYTREKLFSFLDADSAMIRVLTEKTRPLRHGFFKIYEKSRK